MEKTAAQKLEALLKLQRIDSKLDEIIKVRGDLPEEVQDLEDEIAGYETRLSKFQTEQEDLEQGITDYREGIKESEKLIKKYEEQQMKVRNNREYDAITKEIELQQLEIQIKEKKIKESYANIDHKKEDIDKINGVLSERKKDLEAKHGELEVLTGESHEEETKLKKDREKASTQIEERLLNSYNRIRENARNGLAVVIVKRDACGGCFNRVPPQRQADIRDKKKLIVCEHCGRIFADVEYEIVEEEPKKKTRAKKAKA